MKLFPVTTFRNAILIGMLSAALIPALLLSVPLMFRIYSLTKGNAERELSYKATQIAANVEHEIILLANRAMALSDETELSQDLDKPDRFSKIEPYLNHFLSQNTVVSSLYLLDVKGNALATKPEAASSIPVPNSWIQWLSTADKQKGKLNQTSYQILQLKDAQFVQAQAGLRFPGKKDVWRSDPQSDFLLVLFLPIAGPDRPIKGVLAAVIPLENIAQCHLWEVRPTGHFRMLQDGQPLMYSARGSEPEKKEAMIVREASFSLTHSAVGKRINFSVEISEPRSQWFALVRQMIFHQILAVTLCLLLLVALTFVFSRALGKPIRLLTDQVVAYSSGQFETKRPKLDFKELDVFSQTLEQMAKRILTQLNHATQLERWKGEVERAQIQTALNNLREQMRPHFLFNTLNNIAAMVSLDPEQSVQMLTKLSDLYRLILESSKNTTSLLSLEMHIVENYLELQKMRFEHRLKYDLAVPPNIDGVHAPSLLLQTLVENAVKHGISKSREGGAIHLSIEREASGFLVSVRNSGARLVSTEGDGTGLANTRQRLDLLYGAEHGFKIAADEKGDTLVQFKMSGQRL